MARRARGHAVPVAGLRASSRCSRAVNDRTRVVALCNPNDPTGELLGVGELRRAARGAARARRRAARRGAGRLRRRRAARRLARAARRPSRGCSCFRTFSKAWGLAGLRCGYALGGPGAEPLLEQLEPELGVNELAQAGALEALRTLDRARAPRARRTSPRARPACGAARACRSTRGRARPTSLAARARRARRRAGRRACAARRVARAPGRRLGEPDRVRDDPGARRDRRSRRCGPLARARDARHRRSTGRSRPRGRSPQPCSACEPRRSPSRSQGAARRSSPRSP